MSLVDLAAFSGRSCNQARELFFFDGERRLRGVDGFHVFKCVGFELGLGRFSGFEFVLQRGVGLIAAHLTALMIELKNQRFLIAHFTFETALLQLFVFQMVSRFGDFGFGGAQFLRDECVLARERSQRGVEDIDFSAYFFGFDQLEQNLLQRGAP